MQNSNAVFDTLAEPGRVAAADPAEAAGRRCRPRRRRWARSRRWPTSSGRRSRRCGPRRARSAPSLRQTRPFLRESTPIIRDEIRPFTRAALPTVQGAAPGDARPRGGDAGPHASFSVVNRLLNTAAYNPPGRQGGGLPVLAVVGQPRRQLDLLHRRTRTARSGAASSCSPARRRSCWTRSPRPTRSSARSSTCSTRPSRAQICPQSTAGAGGRRLMVKDAPSFGKIAAMVLFALSCFGLLLFLWLAFGGPVPLKPKGYRFHTSFAEAGQLALEADVRIRGVPVGKVKTITPDKVTGRADVEIQLQLALRAAAVGRAGDPAPEDAAGRDLRGAHARATPSRSRSPRAASCRPRRCPTRSSSTRSCARSTPRRARRSRTGCRRRRRRSSGRGQDLNDALGNLAPFAEDTATIVDDPQPPGGRGLAPDRQHRRRLRRADRARRAAALADRELQHGVRDHGGARRASCRRRSARCRRSRRSRARRSSA